MVCVLPVAESVIDSAVSWATGVKFGGVVETPCPG